MIRELNGNDIPAILEMGYDMYSNSSYAVTEWCPAKVAQLCVNLIQQPHMQAWVSEVNGKVVGMFFGMIQEHYFGPTLKSFDLLLYVRPENRGGSHAFKLVKTFIDWSICCGVREDQISVGVTTGDSGDSAVELYKRMGFVESGVILNKG
jgi:GNAT superfamily N-acetyltransferase